jgi:hypothetical protein
MLTPAVLREESRLFRQAATAEITLEIKHRLTNHALALVLLAERIEREEPASNRGMRGMA